MAIGDDQMIRFTRQQLEERAAHRPPGYLEAVLARARPVSPTPSAIGDQVLEIDDTGEAELRAMFNLPAVPKPGTGGLAAPKPGLGDRLAALLARLGLKGWSGCGCAARRQWLNRMGRRIGIG